MEAFKASPQSGQSPWRSLKITPKEGQASPAKLALAGNALGLSATARGSSWCPCRAQGAPRLGFFSSRPDQCQRLHPSTRQTSHLRRGRTYPFHYVKQAVQPRSLSSPILSSNGVGKGYSFRSLGPKNIMRQTVVVA